MSLDKINFDDIEEVDSRDVEFKDWMDQVDPPKKSVNQITHVLPATYDLSDVKVSKEAVSNISKLYEEYNSKYGFDLRVDADDLGQMFNAIIDPKAKKLMELYTVEVYSRLRVVMYNRLSVAIIQLLDDLIKDSTDGSIQVQDKYIMMEKMLEYLYKVNEIYDQIKNEKVEQELSQLAKENEESTDYNYNDPAVQEVIDKLNKTIIKSE